MSFLCDLVGVVQRGVRNRGAGEGHRLENGHRGHRAGPTDLDADVPQHGRGLLGRKLVRDGPPGELGGGAQALPKLDPIDLDHDAVGLEVQVVPAVLPARAPGREGVGARAPLPVRLDRHAPPLQGLERLVVGFEAGGAHDLIGPEPQATSGHLRRIEIPQRAGRRVPWIGEDGLAGLFTLAVDAIELGAREVHLAADLDRVGRRLVQPERHGPDRADVGADLLAALAVSARRAPHEHSVVVGEGHAQAVDLQLGDVLDRLVLEALGDQCLAHALVEGAQLLSSVGVVEAEHRGAVGHRGEPFDRAPADALGRRIRRHQVGMRLLECAELPHERVERGIGDLRIVVDVVPLLVVPDLVAKREDALAVSHRVHDRRQA